MTETLMPLEDKTPSDEERVIQLEKEVERLSGILGVKQQEPPVPGIYQVIYQVRKPRTAPIPYGQVEQANDYVREPKHALVYALNPGLDVLRVLNAKENLIPGEVIDIIKAQQTTAAGAKDGTGGIWQ